MARGKHTKDGYPWGLTRQDYASITIPKQIVPQVRKYAQEIWEELKEESNQLPSSESTAETEES